MRLSLEAPAPAPGSGANSQTVAGRARKQARVASFTATSGAGAKKGDLEVRKDLTIESQRTEMIFFATTTSDPSGSDRSSGRDKSATVTRAKA